MPIILRMKVVIARAQMKYLLYDMGTDTVFAKFYIEKISYRSNNGVLNKIGLLIIAQNKV